MAALIGLLFFAPGPASGMEVSEELRAWRAIIEHLQDAGEDMLLLAGVHRGELPETSRNAFRDARSLMDVLACSEKRLAGMVGDLTEKSKACFDAAEPEKARQVLEELAGVLRLQVDAMAMIARLEKSCSSSVGTRSEGDEDELDLRLRIWNSLSRAAERQASLGYRLRKEGSELEGQCVLADLDAVMELLARDLEPVERRVAALTEETRDFVFEGRLRSAQKSLTALQKAASAEKRMKGKWAWIRMARAAAEAEPPKSPSDLRQPPGSRARMVQGLLNRVARPGLTAEGGNQRTEAAVQLGLDWLARHQHPDGFWDCDGFMNQCKSEECGDPGNALYDPGVSGLALLAFLGAGETDTSGLHGKTVSRGLEYLLQIQDPDGCFGPRITNHFTYNHAICALAMAEAYALTDSQQFKHSAERAIDFIEKARNPDLAWRYGIRPRDNDTSVTGWMVMALASARGAGLRVDDKAFEGARAWIEKATESTYGRVGYISRGAGPARPRNIMDKFPADKSESLTAVGILGRIFVGQDPRQSEIIQKGTDLCLKALPVWDEQSGSIDMYYWYYATLALFQVGGDAWKSWNVAMKTEIIDHQHKENCEKGSWDPVGPWGSEGGRVYSTALMTMCMQAYYRYARLFD